MKPRDLIFLVAAIALLGGLGLVVLDTGGPSDALVEAPAPTITLPADPPPATAPASLDQVRGDVLPDPETIPLDSPPPTHGGGAIRGSISLAAEVVSELPFVYVKIEEAVSRAKEKPTRMPFVKTIREDIIPELGTPEFFYDNIPFSEYGYVVRVFAAEVNGSEQFVHVTEKDPTADVMLSVTRAHPFTVLLRDQRKSPLPEKRVFMVPVGEPRNRQILQKDTDSYGASVFDKVLAGEYEIRVGSINAPLNKPHRFQVIAHAGVRSTTVEVPAGHDYTVLVQRKAGWGIEGAKLMMYSTDQTNWQKYEGTTDYSGKFVFPHLPPGSYHLNVTMTGFEHWGRAVKVEESGSPEPKNVLLIPRTR